MKIIAWNVQGAKKHQIRDEIRVINQSQKPDLMFLIETMVSEQTTRKFIANLGFEHFDFVNPQNHSGGIWVLWNNDNIHANVLLKETRAIHMLVMDLEVQKLSIISGVYAPAQLGQKASFWQHLADLNAVIDSPWCLIGDFNELEDASEKRGGSSLSTLQCRRLPQFLRSINGSSISVKGRSFTWKKRIPGHLIYERLDRAIGRQEWLRLYPNAFVTSGPFTCSDHSYVCLQTSNHIPVTKRPPFRFQPNWNHYEDVQSIVKKQWSLSSNGSLMFRFASRLKAIKHDLKRWSTSKFANYRAQIEKNTTKLQYVENQLLESPNNYRLNHWHFRLLKQREKLMLFHQRYWGQFARKQWLINGDRNSKFFHKLAIARKRRRHIVRIKDAAGVWLDEMESIKEKFLLEFSCRFKSSRSPNWASPDLSIATEVTQADNDALIRPVTEKEIHSALFQMDPYKAPGPDGFGASFYQKHWPIIKTHLCAAIKDFFRSGKILKEFNHTFIALIPKVDNPETTSQFRPISLCNTFYKIVAKVLVNRLRPILERIIHPVQSAFVSQRAIHDNILLAHEVINKFHHLKGKKGYAAVKIDMEKAYDRIEWDFLLKCLEQLGFHPIWINWIRECVTTVSYSVLVNNEPCGFFKPTRGLRQGDPLSPYLFLICMDVLAKRLAHQALNSKSGIGFKLAPRADRIPCLFFADDSLLFCKATSQAVLHLKSLLDTFCHQSGQLINLQKSMIVFSKNTPSLDRQHVKGVLNIPTSSALGKYLGCASFQGRPSSESSRILLIRHIPNFRIGRLMLFLKLGA